MDLGGIGKLLIAAGVIALMAGVALLLASRSEWLSGLLQSGTLRFDGGNFTCVIPIAAMILLSIILTIALNLLIRFLNK